MSQAIIITVTRCPWEPNLRACLLIEQILSSHNLAQTISAQNMVIAASIRAGTFSKRVKKPACVHSEVTPFPEATEVCIFHCPRGSFNYHANALQYFLWFKALFYEGMSRTCMKLRYYNISQSSKYSAADIRYSETSWLEQNFSFCLQKCLCKWKQITSHTKQVFFLLWKTDTNTNSMQNTPIVALMSLYSQSKTAWMK